MTDMNNDVSKDDDKNYAAAQEETLGAVLKQAREQKGLSQQEVSTRLHLRVSVIDEIEQDDFRNISSNTYIRGYVRNYARFLEIESSRIEACLTRQVPVVSAPVMQSFSRKTTQKSRDNWLMIITYLIIIVSLALLVLWWWQKPAAVTENFSQPTAEELQPEAASAPVMALDGHPAQNGGDVSALETGIVAADAVTAQDESPVVTGGDNDAEDALSQRAAQGLEPQDLEPQALATQSAATPASTQDAANSGVLRIVLSGDCWIQATDAEGNTLVDGLKSAGHQVDVSGKPPINLVLGAPQSVSLNYNGTAVDLSRFANGRVARLTLPQA
ncbi:cytoskeleton protein RodZ [Shewanella sp. YIC-542]|uniref:cytoskeleton protein RodZ n=1 Tax=Shewanella mytili TaxID=3377111 RepID=UPI00398EA21C